MRTRFFRVATWTIVGTGAVVAAAASSPAAATNARTRQPASRGATKSTKAHSPGARGAARVAMTPPVGFAEAPLLLDDDFIAPTVRANGWNPFITSRAANGVPWNSNGSGGSGVQDGAQIVNVEYDLPNQLHIGREGLEITATRRNVVEPLGSGRHTYPWVSGVVSSYGHFEFTGGYVQIRAKMPSGSGMWPGLWLLPGPSADDGDNYEVDIFEGGETGHGERPATSFSWHLHGPDGVVGTDVATGLNLDSGFHTYGLEWIPGQAIRWYIDGREVGSVTSSTASIPNEPMELLMNLQVAGSDLAGWRSVPNGATAPDQTMIVSGVQVYG
jgi:hypothetical protein